MEHTKTGSHQIRPSRGNKVKLPLDSSSKNGVAKLVILTSFALFSMILINDFIVLMYDRRRLCEEGDVQAARSLLRKPRNLASTIVAFVEESLNGDVDPCETNFPDNGLFGEYPPLPHDGGDMIPRRPQGTIAYAVTITRCPEFYEPGVDKAPDPGADLFEATAIIKDEICNFTATMNKLTESGESADFTAGQTL